MIKISRQERIAKRTSCAISSIQTYFSPSRPPMRIGFAMPSSDQVREFPTQHGNARVGQPLTPTKVQSTSKEGYINSVEPSRGQIDSACKAEASTGCKAVAGCLELGASFVPSVSALFRSQAAWSIRPPQLSLLSTGTTSLCRRTAAV